MVASLGSLVAAFWATLHLRTLLLGAVVFLFLVAFLKTQRPKTYPPGPWRLPFVGNMFQVDFENSHLQIQKLTEKYGNILSLDFGTLNSVLITGMPLIKEIFIHSEQSFINRPITATRERVFGKNGLVMSNGQIWKEQRRFTLTTFRNFGLGKKSLEQRIQEEAQHLVEDIENEKGQPFNPQFKINNAVSNIICSIVFGERFEYQDGHFQKMLKLLDELVYLEASIMGMLYNTFPSVMKFIPGQHQKIFSNWDKLKSFISYEIEKHKRDRNPDDPRDFIDAYLNEMAKHPDKNATSFHEENLICSTLDLFLAGTETTSTTLRWGLLFMALNPEIQEKAQAEIDRVIGREKQPNLADRESLPYTYAVIHEVQRMGNIIPFNVPREVASDTTLSGYHLPKGTMILANLTALHNDPKEWATPDTFNPEHFLENGQFKKKECFLPFGMGKRVCLGEQLARSELFIFFTFFLQNFTFKPPKNEKLSLKVRPGLTLSPVSHRICAIPRA
ncbi:cytochrome P450 2J2-like [Perognathus longimembris pacificus]|uniref:cytochrome P450 2J2-like n=1 Tax=Perognathus longimembris pacificus TaxID=214514 RepID=UPI0020192A04|nr:cytochrome P450 2J2-like [Perognathus longimembris pacificus]